MIKQRPRRYPWLLLTWDLRCATFTLKYNVGRVGLVFFFHIYFSPPSAVLCIWFSSMRAECGHYCSAFCECNVNKHLSICSASCFLGKATVTLGLTGIAGGFAGEKKPIWLFCAAAPQHQMNMVQIQTTALPVTLLMQVEWMRIICSSTDIFWGCKT